MRLCVLILACSAAIAAQSKPSAFTKIYIGTDFLVHLVDGAGKDVSIAAESEQKAVSKLQLSPDRRVAGWQIETDNCCTSYTIPTRLMIDRNGKTLVIEPGQMIYDWCFADSEGSQVAVSIGPAHGTAPRHLLLYNAATGRQLKQWTGDPAAAPPDWASRLTQ